MATIVTIQAADAISSSRTDINANFANLNSDKVETSVLDTDTSLAANSDSKVATQRAVKTYIDTGGSASFISSLVPIGLILPYGGSSAPTNWFLCDGSAKSRTTYASLFAVIGTAYGSGDGSTTFNVPDMRGRAPVGAGTGTKVATFASRSGNVITVTGLTNAANNEFQTGQAVVYASTGTVITGLTSSTTYYVVRTGNLTFSLASSLANAQNGTVISLSSDGTGTQTFTLTLSARSVGDTGGEEAHAMSSSELLSHQHAAEYAGGPDANNYSLGTGTAVGDGNSGATGGNAAMNVMQPFVSTNFIIKHS